MNKLREVAVKMLYPICSDEVKILIDQMRNNPDRFVEIIEDRPYMSTNPWSKAMGHGRNFELWEYQALKLELRNIKIRYAKQLILEGLMEANERESNRTETKTMYDSIAEQIKAKYVSEGHTTASKIIASQHQMEVLKKAYHANQIRMQKEMLDSPLTSTPPKQVKMAMKDRYKK